MLNTGRIIALAGNPNVGKSTVFNALTGLKQHTGNWPGKTVENARGHYTYKDQSYTLVDLPGCYSLMAHSCEEEIARDFICFQQPDAVVVVCDATCLERNLNLALQIMEITPRVVVCVNLMDEAAKKGIRVDLDALSDELGVPVLGTAARSKKGLDALVRDVARILDDPVKPETPAIRYPDYIETAVSDLRSSISQCYGGTLDGRWLAIRLLDGDVPLQNAIRQQIQDGVPLWAQLECMRAEWRQSGVTEVQLKDDIVAAVMGRAEAVCRRCIIFENPDYGARDRKIDRVLMSRWLGFPLMGLLLLLIFWITIEGANYPSMLLNKALSYVEEKLLGFLIWLGTPKILYEMLIYGVYRVLAWVVSVMLPPMAIFFPLFTLLEDSGYLPRIAFNLDKIYKKCRACGKQALTMCMGFGCNAVGVTGCRIIDSPRERLIAIITNSFVPCNGRFPILISIISMFFIGSVAGFGQSALSALLLTGVIALSVLMTFLISRILSATVLKGMPSSFILELPPYRKPQVGKVIIRSLLDRTLFVLGRAVMVAAPAGLVLWLMANTTIGDATLLAHCSHFLDPFGRLLGMDGVILLAFILGMPANETVIPIILMAYMAQGHITGVPDLPALRLLLLDNGWNIVTAVSVMLFSLMHWPCATTCLTIKKETQSWKWTLISFLVPTLTGMLICFIFANTARLFM